MSVYTTSLAMRPHKYNFAYNLINSLNDSFWTLDKIGSLTSDVIDFRDANETDKYVVSMILRVFTQLEISVAKNYCDTFIPTFKNLEVRMALVAIAQNESIHAISYDELARELHFPDEFQTEFKKIQELNKKDEYLNIPKNNNLSSVQNNLIALSKSVFGEGVSLFGSFTILLNYMRNGRFLKFGDITAYSLVDESHHVEFISNLFKEIAYKEFPEALTDEVKKLIYSDMRNCVALEIEFINGIYSKSEDDIIDGMQKQDLIQYIKFLADRRLLQIGFKPEYGIKTDTLKWVTSLCFGDEHASFFEVHNSSYVLSNFEGDLDDWSIIEGKT